MLNNYNIEQINGENERVFMLIAPFAMNAKVLRTLGNYPILTSDKHIWFIAIEKTKVVGFAAVKMTGTKIIFTYAYVTPEYRKRGIHRALFQRRMDWAINQGIKTIVADCTDDSLNIFTERGFTIEKKFQKWTKVKIEL